MVPDEFNFSNQEGHILKIVIWQNDTILLIIDLIGGKGYYSPTTARFG